MKRILMLCGAFVLFCTEHVLAQNVFNPNDAIVEYDSLNPPAVPAANTLVKWVRTKSLTWNTDRYKSYYFNGMAFRLRYPNGYNPADLTKKYPLVLFLHGGGEIGPATTNEVHLIHTGQTFQDMIDAGRYNAFLLYPLVSESDIWQDYHFKKVNSILDSLQKYCNVDQDKVMTMGLSMGAFGAFRYTSWYPERSALATGASPALIEALEPADRDKLVHMPLWVGNGGQDVNPSPTSVQNFVDYMTSKGASVKHSFYPDAAHAVWGPMYDPNDVLPYWQTAHKANPAVFFGRTQFDQNVAISNKLGITANFWQYEWQRNNVTIATSTNNVNSIIDGSSIISFTGNEITVNSYGTYRVRFKRFSNSAWSDWSPNPVVLYNGVKYRYYQGDWSTLPDFNALTPVTTGTAPNITINSRPANTPTDHYGFVWEGKIFISTPGDYTFETISDDGSKLYFNTSYSANAVPLVNNDGPHDVVSVKGTVNIPSPGAYPFAVAYFEKDGGEAMQVYWSGPGFSRQLIPDSAFTKATVTQDNVPPTVPSNLTTTYIGRTFADITWDYASDNVGVSRYDIYVNGSFRMSTTTPSASITNLTPATSYSFTVKAADQGNNVSAASTPISVTASATGLRYKYYQGVWSTLPNFSNLTPLKTGKTSNVDISLRNVNDTFAFVWEGYINIKTPGTYTFETVSDDGSKLYFNSLYSSSATATVNNDGAHPAVSATGTVNVSSAGWYPISITFFEKDGGESMQVYWSGPGISRQLIPASVFAEEYGDNIAPTTPANLKSTYTGRTFIDLAWDNSTDNVSVVRYEVYMNGSLKMSTATQSASVSGLTPGTSYSFTVKAFDQAGNASASSNTVSANAVANGLKYRYYEGSWNTLPDFSALTPVKTGTSPNIDITSARNVNDNFGYVWEGYINIKNPGTYTFETVSDDGSKFYFNTLYSPSATALVNNDGLHAAQTASGSVNIPSAGLYPVSITFFEKDGGESMQLIWSGPGVGRQQVPDAAFVENYSDTQAPSAPANLKSAYTARTFVDLAWDNSTDNVGVSRYDVYMNDNFMLSTSTPTASVSGLTAGTSYSFTVKAFDQAGNTSGFSNTLGITASANGLRYKYYLGNYSTLPDFNTLTPAKTGTTPNVDFSPRTVEDYFAFVWEGYINIKTPGTYTFETVSDDGSKLYFNNFYSPSAVATVNNDGVHGPISATGTVNIPAAGLYPITMTFFEKAEGQTMLVYWSGPGFSRRLIPDAAFTENFNGSSDLDAQSARVGMQSMIDQNSSVLSSAYPNPFNKDLKINFVNTARDNDVSVGIYDLSGRLLYNRRFGKLAPGTNTLQLNLAGQSQIDVGTYIARLEVNGLPVKTWKIIKTKK